MKKTRVRIVVDDHVTENHLTAVASDQQWVISRSFDREGDQPQERVYSTSFAKGATDIHWVEDHKIGVNYMLVEGPALAKVVEVLQDKMDYLSSETIWEEATDAKATAKKRAIALYNLALDKMEHGFDPATFALFEAAMQDRSALVRGAAVLGSAYLGWKQLAAPLRALATEHEHDRSIREDAALLLSRLSPP